MFRLMAAAAAAALALPAAAGSTGHGKRPDFGIGSGANRSVFAPGVYYVQDFQASGFIKSATISVKLPPELIPVRYISREVVAGSDPGYRAYLGRPSTPYRVVNGRLEWWVRIVGKEKRSRIVRVNVYVSPRARPGTKLCINVAARVVTAEWRGVSEYDVCTKVVRKLPLTF